jgi:hypothetical protein
MAVVESAFIGAAGYEAMTSEEIKTGSQVVTEFLESLQEDPDIDIATLLTLRELFQAQKLTKTRLLRVLEEQRAEAVARTLGQAARDP